jgi:hypothetical protein
MLRQSSGVIGMRATVPICASLDLDFAVSALKYLHPASVSTILHDEARRNGYGSINLPEDHRRSRRTPVGKRELTLRGDVSIHFAR